MAQTGFTPILIYASSTPSAVPSASNLTSTSSGAELALNYSDGKLFYKDSGGVVQVLAGKGGSGVVAGSNTQIQFNNNGVFGASSGLTWDGTNLTATQLRSSGLTSGRVTYASTSGLLVDSANMTFNGTTLTVADIADSSLTSGRVTYAGAGGNLTDSANLTFNGTSLVLGSSTANLGLGATPSAWGTSGSILNALQIGAAGSVSAENVGGAIHLSQNAYFDGANWRFIQTAAAGNYYIFGDSHAWRISIPGTAGNIISFTQAMTLSSSGNLGIGTTSPARTLHVQGSSSGIMRLQGPISGGAIEIVGPSNSNYIGTPAAISGGSATDLAFYVGSTQYMVIDNSGNVGIGTSSPSAKLQVVGSVAISNNLTLSGGTANGVAYLNGSKVLTTGSALTFDGTNLGIGTSSPGTKLVVTGAGNITTTISSSSGFAQLSLSGSSGNSSFISYTTTGGGGLGFYDATAAAERMRLDSSGNLGIGTSSLVTKFTVQDTERFEVGGGSGFTYNQSVNAARSATVEHRSYGLFLTFGTGAAGSQAERMRLDSSGNLGLGVTPSAWTTTAGISALQVSSRAALWGDTTQTILSNNMYASSTGDRYIATANASLYTQISGQHRWLTAASGTAGNTISFTQSMTLDASGNLGIGTSSPASNSVSIVRGAGVGVSVEIAGNGNTPASTSVTISQANDNSAYVWNRANSFLSFGTNNTERARIDTSGNLGLGVTPSAWIAYKAFQIGLDGSVFADSGSSEMTIGQNVRYDGSFKYINTQAAGRYRLYNGQHAWFTAPSGTAGNAITFTQAMTLDASGQLGIGTTSPLARLHVYNGSYGTAVLEGFYSYASSNYNLRLKNDGATSGYLSQVPAAGGIVVADGMRYYGGGPWTPDGTSASSIQQQGGNIIFTSNAGLTGGVNFTPTERMRLDSSGNLGLGVTPSAWGAYAAQQNQRLGLYGSTGNGGVSFNSYYDGAAWRYIGTDYATNYDQYIGQHRWFTAPSGTAGNAITFTQAMTLDASGNLGIGTTSPVGSNRKLEVGLTSAAANYIRVNASSSGSPLFESLALGAASAFFGVNATGSPIGGIAAGTFGIGSSDGYAMSFGTSNTERARITSGGDLLVGTTSGSNHRIFKDSSGGIALQVYNSSTTNTSSVMDVNVNYSGNTSGWFFRGGDSSIYRFYIYSNGDVVNSNNSYGAISDAKLKENITDATPKLEKINQVRVVNYNIKGDTQKQIGVIAQELEQIFPGMVEESPDLDAEGTDLGTTTKSVKYSVFVPILIKAMQEQQAIITDLRARVAQLESKGA